MYERQKTHEVWTIEDILKKKRAQALQNFENLTRRDALLDIDARYLHSMQIQLIILLNTQIPKFHFSSPFSTEILVQQNKTE